ncbi:MAG: DUF4345 family protein [Rhodospirillaceae bacterium]|nr:DUF4345 family protein [Rhodospirillaceae bacterium]
MVKARLWFARAVMGYALLIFGFLGRLFFLDPLEGIKSFGVTLADPHSITFIRTSLGAMFVGFAVTALYGLARPDRFLSCLWFLVVMNVSIVAARLYGLAVDGVTPKNLSELTNEGLSTLLFIVALVAYPRAKPN